MEDIFYPLLRQIDSFPRLLIKYSTAPDGESQAIEPKSVEDNGKTAPNASLWAIAANAGTELVAAVGLGFFGGRWLDAKFSMSPWLSIVGSFFGVAIGLYELIRIAKSNEKSSSQRKPDRHPGNL